MYSDALNVAFLFLRWQNITSLLAEDKLVEIICRKNKKIVRITLAC